MDSIVAEAADTPFGEPLPSAPERWTACSPLCPHRGPLPVIYHDRRIRNRCACYLHTPCGMLTAPALHAPGDKTFLIAAIMAVRHPRITVFGGAFSSLIVMSVLSAALGRMILGLIPRVWTHYAVSAVLSSPATSSRLMPEQCSQAALLFLVFGVRMLQEGLKIPAGQGHIQEEMREVEEELDEDEQSSKMDRRGLSGLEAMEEGLDGTSAGSPLMAQQRGEEDGVESNGNGHGHGYKMSSLSKHRGGVSITPGRRSQTFHPLSQPSPVAPVSVSNPLLRSFLTKLRGVARRNVDARDLKAGFRNTCGMFFSPVFAQAFVLTFLGEWGDRSQIATIALAGANVGGPRATV